MIPALLGAIFLGFICLIIGNGKVRVWVRLLVAIPLVFIVVVMTLLISRGDDFANKVPFISKSSSEVTVKEGVFTLKSGVSSTLGDEFVFTGEPQLEDIESFLNNTTKAVYIYIKSGQDIIYSNNLGLLQKDDAQYVLDLYNNWKTTCILPSERTRYKFFCFYCDV